MASAGTDVYITGSYNGTINFDTCMLSSSTSQMYIAKLGATAIITGIKKNESNSSLFIVYPSPGNGLFTIQFVPESEHAVYTYCITNTTGQTLYTETVKPAGAVYSKQLDLSHLPKGSYFVNLYNCSSSNSKQPKECRKLVLQ